MVNKKIHLQYEDGFFVYFVKIRSESTKFFGQPRLTKPMLGVEFCIKITVFRSIKFQTQDSTQFSQERR
ncbi:hypothetical protein CGSHi3655_00834 [Haemophilus influenzae 3655]|uniref:Uncharacterized protein n=1 Tax=Haemophilus influenzae (strain NTHi 3655) TaxID=375177 RepID=A0A0H3PB80_HAEI3|nr:hypothetical protein CGSHiEE_08970 [Haemophilus influenzae PittEE]EDJ92144.1 hypothetical protein CGSHi3655_00834 [Haemophilus influenzae 3655]EEP45391.1 hypothetical protein CGSHi7P49H1_08599 [Haemophilus influenzae 7P49H1]EEW77661.1 conserved hypothetical protein [Haemophilus influenzae NT127]KMZ22166.1 hypothetical protein ABN83_05395 [Haemophilus influenzae]OFK55127.1 hypothetical protein HMPREF2813_09235 [Haemophilus sp. HMSC066A11]